MDNQLEIVKDMFYDENNNAINRFTHIGFLKSDSDRNTIHIWNEIKNFEFDSVNHSGTDKFNNDDVIRKHLEIKIILSDNNILLNTENRNWIFLLDNTGNISYIFIENVYKKILKISSNETVMILNINIGDFIYKDNYGFIFLFSYQYFLEKLPSQMTLYWNYIQKNFVIGEDFPLKELTTLKTQNFIAYNNKVIKILKEDRFNEIQIGEYILENGKDPKKYNKYDNNLGVINE